MEGVIPTLLSVSGPFEAGTDKLGNPLFRVFVDNDNYAYFGLEDIDGVVIHKINGDENAVIYLH